MGQRGIRPMPTELAKRLGSHHLSERRNEVKPNRGCPPIPSWVKGEARNNWKHIAKWLGDVGLITHLDQVALGLLCDALAHYFKLRKRVEKEGWTAVSSKGGEYQHPAVGAMNKARESVLKLLREFGMTPSARAGLAIAGSKSEDPMTDLLKRITEKHVANIEKN